MEVYVRLNGGCDNDYAFQIGKDDTVKKLDRIFAPGGKNAALSSLMVLRPTIFHESTPRGYDKSIHPGFLTEGGCLLFHYDADDAEYLKPLDPEKPLSQQLWPGQLIVPRWHLSKKTLITYSAIMLAWLYTDLPDAISPTPGMCLTNQLSRMFIPLARHLEYHHIAEKLQEEIAVNYSSLLAQWSFFVLHVLKIAFFTMFFATGIANPISYNPFKLWRIQNLDLRGENFKDLLRSIGWIGTKRATYDEYQTNFYNYTVEKFGGTVKAYRAGMIKTAAAPGVTLYEGEGYQTPLNSRHEVSTFETMEKERKFLLGEDYFMELETCLKNGLEECNGDVRKMNDFIRKFRRFGIYESSDKLKKLVEQRKEVMPEGERVTDSKSVIEARQKETKKEQ